MKRYLFANWISVLKRKERKKLGCYDTKSFTCHFAYKSCALDTARLTKAVNYGDSQNQGKLKRVSKTDKQPKLRNLSTDFGEAPTTGGS